MCCITLRPNSADRGAQVYTMRDLNPLQFFRGTAADVVGELPDRKPELTKKPLTKVPSLLFDMEVQPRRLAPLHDEASPDVQNSQCALFGPRGVLNFVGFCTQLEEGQGRKETETTAHDSQKRLEHLAQPWSAPERQVRWTVFPSSHVSVPESAGRPSCMLACSKRGI